MLLGIFLTQLDVGLVAVALPGIARSQGTELSSAQAIVVVYLAFLALGVIPLGALADRWSLAGVFRCGLVVFALASGTVAVAPHFTLVLAARGLQGLSAAAVLSAGQALAFGGGEVRRPGRNLGLVHFAVAAGLAAGPIVGGLVLERAPWQQLFLIEPPLAMLAALVGLGPRAKPSRPPSLPPVRSLLRRDLVIGLATAALAFVAMSANMFVIPFFLQRPLGLSPASAGLLMAIVPLAILLVAPLAGTLADRLGSRRPATSGLVLVALGVAGFALSAVVAVPSAVAPALLFYALGAALFQSPNNRAVLASVPEERVGLASGLLAASRQLGQIVGVGLSGGLLLATSSDLTVPTSYVPTFVALAGVAVGAAFLSAGRAEARD